MTRRARGRSIWFQSPWAFLSCPSGLKIPFVCERVFIYHYCYCKINLIPIHRGRVLITKNNTEIYITCVKRQMIQIFPPMLSSAIADPYLLNSFFGTPPGA